MNANDSNAGIILPNVLVLLLVSWGIVGGTDPLNSRRPSSEGGKVALAGPTQPIVARSWEDPFEAIAGEPWVKHKFWTTLWRPDEFEREVKEQARVEEKGAEAASQTEKEPGFRLFGKRGTRQPGSVKNEEDDDWPQVHGQPILDFRSDFENFHQKLGQRMEEGDESDKGLLLMVTLPGAPFAMSHERRHRTRYAVVSGLANAGYKPVDDSRLGVSGFVPRFGEEEDQGYKPEMVLWEQFEPSSHLTEWREKRYLRIMVVYLNEDYLLRPLPYGYARLTGRTIKKSWFEKFSSPLEDNEDWRLDTSRGFFHSGSRDSVKSPLTSLAVMIESLRKNAQSGEKKSWADVEVQIVGPSNSDLLVSMMGEALEAEWWDLERERNAQDRLRGFRMDIGGQDPDDESGGDDESARRDSDFRSTRIWAASPTISDRQLKVLACNYARSKIPVKGRGDELRKREELRDSLLEQAYDKARKGNGGSFRFFSGLQVERMSPDDGLLCKALVEELSNRGIRPAEGKDSILLVTEFETSYARAIVQSFRVAALDPKGVLGENRENQIDIGHEEIVQQVSYLRGLDGMAGLRRQGGPAGSKVIAEGAAGQKVEITTESPMGYSQFDYLQRLVKRVRYLDRSRGDRKFKAIGVLGSDIFDKLIILRALRSEFPDAVFFTTDLDAVYLDKSEEKWTRNLIVASGYGLTHDPRIQNTIPPFRDSNQASAYLATLEAVGYFEAKRHRGEAPRIFAPERKRGVNFLGDQDGGEAIDKVTRVPKRPSAAEARLFEIGRSGPQLLATYGEEKGMKKLKGWEARGSFDLGFWGSVVIIVLLGGCMMLTLSPVLRYWWDQNRKAEKMRRRQGVFMADANANVYVFAALLSGWVGVMVLWYFVDRAHARPREEPFGLADGVSAWPTAFIQLLTVILAIFCVWKAWKDLQTNRQEIDSRYEDALRGGTDVEVKKFAWLMRLINAYWFLIDSERIARAQRTFPAFWRVYRNRSRQRERMARAFIPMLCLSGFAFWGTRVEFGGSMVPVRGEDSRTVFVGIQLLAFCSAQFLLFYAVDAALLCWALLRGIRVLVVRGQRPIMPSPFGSPFEWEQWAEAQEAERKRAEEQGETYDPKKVRLKEKPSGMVRLKKELYGRWETILVLIGAERGRQVNSILVLPFVVFFLLLVSRHRTFDHFPFAYTIIVPTVLAFVVLASAAMLMRSSAKAVFCLVEERLREARELPDPQRYEPVREEKEPESIDDVPESDRVKEPKRSRKRVMNLEEWLDLREKALQADSRRLAEARQAMEFRFRSNPVLKGILIPLGGTGVLALLEMLAPLLRQL